MKDTLDCGAILEPKGFTGFGYDHYCPVAAWPEDTRTDYSGMLSLYHLGYWGPGMWADAEGGLQACGMLDADLP